MYIDEVNRKKIDSVCIEQTGAI